MLHKSNSFETSRPNFFYKTENLLPGISPYRLIFFCKVVFNLRKIFLFVCMLCIFVFTLFCSIYFLRKCFHWKNWKRKWVGDEQSKLVHVYVNSVKSTTNWDYIYACMAKGELCSFNLLRCCTDEYVPCVSGFLYFIFSERERKMEERKLSITFFPTPIHLS